jgi:hypothetical protein
MIEKWHCEQPGPGQGYVVVREEFEDTDPPIRHVHEVRLVEAICPHPQCPWPMHGNHYHCGRCRSPEPTGHQGHYGLLASGAWGFACETPPDGPNGTRALPRVLE